MSGSEAGDGADPYTLSDREEDGDGAAHHVFWADEIADRIEERDPEEPIVIKGGISPSGVPHLGNMNEVMRGYFVAEVLRERGYEVRQVFTSDDRDPLRKVPRKLADLDGDIVGLGEVDGGALGRNLGKPYTAIPDPFGCCDSYGDHFSTLIQDGATQLGVDIEVLSNTELYESGAFEDVTRELLATVDLARETLSPYQDSVDESYVPCNPICENCGKITDDVTRIDAESGTVDYRCTDIEAGDRTIAGCGHEGTATVREGKLPWRFEWPAQWRVLGVDFEPFGKDHAEGSWPSGQDVARTVLGDQPPVPMVYEWFTLEGKPFSSSEGHVVLVSDVLALVEPAVLRYFFAKDPARARDFSVERIDQLVDEFDRVERLYYGDVEGTEQERRRAERVYPLVVDGDPEPERPLRIPYTFAAVLGMFDDSDLQADVARKEGHVPDGADETTVETALQRVDRARAWARRTDNEFNYELQRSEIPETAFESGVEAALDDLAAFVAEGHDGEAIQGEIYETAKRHDVEMGDLFGAGYRLFFDQSEGPQLGQFLGKLDREFVVERLRRER